MFSMARSVVPRCRRILRVVDAIRAENNEVSANRLTRSERIDVARAHNCKSNGVDHKAPTNPRPPTSHVHCGDVTTMGFHRRDNDKLCNEDLTGGGTQSGIVSGLPTAMFVSG